jgi:hypothetical protein
MIRSFETERMRAQPVRLEDAEHVQKIFPHWADQAALRYCARMGPLLE